MKRALIALMLSACVLPGLGQLYLGRRTKGVALIMAINLLLLVSLFFAMKVSSPVIGARLAGSPLTASLIMEQVQPYSLWGKLLLASFFGLWGFSVVDLFSAFRKGPA